MDSLPIVSFAVLFFLTFFVFGITSTVYWFKTPMQQLKNQEPKIHWSKKFLWYYGFSFFIFVASVIIVGCVLLLGLTILKGINV